MKYLALLRGINVGGNGIVTMSALKEAFTKAGFTHVSTYINSGNIVFESDETNKEKLTQKIDALLEKKIFTIKTIVLSYKELCEVIKHIPTNWENEDLRKYIAFIRLPLQPDDIIKEAQLKEDIDFIAKGPAVVYMSTKMSGLTKSSFPKLIAKKIYQNITMRNYNTVHKLFTLMEKKQKRDG